MKILQGTIVHIMLFFSKRNPSNTVQVRKSSLNNIRRRSLSGEYFYRYAEECFFEIRWWYVVSSYCWWWWWKKKNDMPRCTLSRSIWNSDGLNGIRVCSSKENLLKNLSLLCDGWSDRYVTKDLKSNRVKHIFIYRRGLYDMF